MCYLNGILVFCVISFVVCFLVHKFSSFRRDHGFNRILKKEWVKRKAENF